MKFLLTFSALILFGFYDSCNQKPSVLAHKQFKSLATNQNLDWQFLLPTSTSKVIVKHDFFTLSYKEEFEQAEWVAYELKVPKTKVKFKRPYFVEDPKVVTQSADWKNFRKSGFDKGHLCAAADMKISKKAYDDTFFTSNISPQRHDFNDGIWKRLENKSRYWASMKNNIFVITGGVLRKGLPTIGFENVAVPEYFYKILCCNNNGQIKMIAFLIPHNKSDKAIYDFVVSVDLIESKTGIDFFKNLNDAEENKLESQIDLRNWVKN